MRGIAAMLSRRLGQDAAIAFLARCASCFTAANAPRLAPKAHDLRTRLGLPHGDPVEWQAATLAGGAIAGGDIAAVAASGRDWGTKTGEGRAVIMDDWSRADRHRSEEHTSELQSLMRTSYDGFCLKKKKHK